MRKAIKTSARVQVADAMYLAKVRWNDGLITKGTGWSKSEALSAAKKKIRHNMML